MEEHECKQEKELGEMMSLLRTLVQQVYGNGQKGLVVTVPILSTKIDTLTETISLLTTNVSALMKFQSGSEGIERYRDKEGLSSRQRAGIIVSAIIGSSAIITAIILKFI